MENSPLQIHWCRELDGIHYASLSLSGQSWRLGSVREDWQEQAAAAIDQGVPGIWALRAGSPANLAAMCCGLGSVWPGMGRELYESYPVARAAMDSIASLADWDILGLMDETGPEKISQSRWQIPYLFMLEYAQWRQFRSLGLKPSVIFGHSLGELIALCFADVYDVRSAWLVLETRSEHMQELEARGDRQGGMLAVPAEQAEIDEILAQWPDLSISNRNTARQFILSGNREHLLEARRSLRRKHIPAVMLNMDLAFHNPAMRILRDISFRRMNGLNMQPAQITMLSCVTTRPYPQTREEICRAIVDLDENTVDWLKLIEVARKNYKAGAWLEFGPQETLCGITCELVPGSEFFASDRKNHEAETMAETCARLFACGYLDQEAINQECARRKLRKWPAGRIPLLYKPQPVQLEIDENAATIDAGEQAEILRLIAEVSGAEHVTPEMELRRDLGLRSASFPFLMLEAETRLGRQARLENLFQITTVLDLVRFLTGAASETGQTRAPETREEFRLSRLPVKRLVWQDGKLTPAPLNPAARKRRYQKIELQIYDSFFKSKIESSLSALGCHLIPAAREPWFSSQPPGPHEPDAIIFAPPAMWGMDRPRASETFQVLARQAAAKNALLCIVQRFAVTGPVDPGIWFTEMERALARENVAYKLIACPSLPAGQQAQTFADLLNWELLGDASERCIVLDGLAGSVSAPQFCLASYGQIWPDSEPGPEADGSVFQYKCQFSGFSLPGIETHGANAAFTPLSLQNCHFKKAPWLPLSQLLEVMARAATLSDPWLGPCGFTDLRIGRFTAIPEGVTRECRLVARPRLELPLGGAMTRHCRVNMSIAELAGNGRKNGVWQKLCDSIFLLCRQAPAPGPVESFYGSGRPLDISLLYETLAFGEEWRRLVNLREARWQNGAIGLEARILPLTNAPNFRFYDYALLAAFCSLGLAGAEDISEVAARLSQWRFCGMGFTRFDFSRSQGEYRLLLRPTWRSDRLARFEIHVLADNGRPVLALYNLEFDSVQGG